MKCPIFYTGWLDHESKDAKEHTNCLKEECAWWDEDFEMCSAKQTSRRLRSIANILDEMREISGGVRKP